MPELEFTGRWAEDGGSLLSRLAVVIYAINR